MTTVAEFLDNVRSSTTLHFAERVTVRHLDKDLSYTTGWKCLSFSASCIMCDFHVNNQQEIDSISRASIPCRGLTKALFYDIIRAWKRGNYYEYFYVDVHLLVHCYYCIRRLAYRWCFLEQY